MKHLKLGVLVMMVAVAFASGAAAQENLTLTATAEHAAVALGENIEIEVVLTNGGAPREVSELLLEDRSVSLELTVDATSFVYTRAIPDPQVQGRARLGQVNLATGKSLISRFRVPAVLLGATRVVVLYRGGGAEVRSGDVNVEVKEAPGGNRLIATLEVTKHGALTIDLDPKSAPLSVTNFVALARSGFYDDMIFDHVTATHWIQTGCPYGLGFGGPGYAVKSEREKTAASEFVRGTVAFCGFEKDGSVGSRFFICTGKVATLKGKYPIFGAVASDETSQATLKKVSEVATNADTDVPTENVHLSKVTIAATR